MTSRRISDLLNSAPHKLKIKDYAKVNEIFKLYLEEKYDTMAREIYWYKSFEFFRDLALYLSGHFKTEAYRGFFYRDMVELYEERLDSIWYENELKRERKKHRL
jgi:hypothetical protein